MRRGLLVRTVARKTSCPPRQDRADQVQHRKQQDHIPRPKPGGDALGEQSAAQAAKRTHPADPSEQLLRRTRFERLVHERPEPGNQHRSERDHVEIDHTGRQSRAMAEKQPLAKLKQRC